MDERNQDFKNLGLIFSSRWDMTMTDIILHNNSADKDVLLKKDKTQQLIRSCCVIVCLVLVDTSVRLLLSAAPTGVSQTTRLHFKVSIIDWGLFQKWGQRWGRFGWETVAFCVWISSDAAAQHAQTDTVFD